MFPFNLGWVELTIILVIVVGSQGLSGIDRFILGSVSEKVMRYAHCSVLVVKAPSNRQ